MPLLRAVLNTYLHDALMQSSQSAACSLSHSLVQRLSRWLLTAQDRSDKPELAITQDLLARSLGVRRASVSDALKPLEGSGIFARERGLIRILDRARLEQLACRCAEAGKHRGARRRDAGRCSCFRSSLCSRSNASPNEAPGMTPGVPQGGAYSTAPLHLDVSLRISLKNFSASAMEP